MHCRSSEQAVFTFIRTPPTDLRRQFASLDPIEREMLVQEHRELTDFEDAANERGHKVSLACRYAETLMPRGDGTGSSGIGIPIHPVLEGWRRPSFNHLPDPQKAADLLIRFADWWPTEGNFTRRMALARLLLPEAFAALAVLRGFGAPDEIAATGLPIISMQQTFAPSPEGWELWLQRRAMLIVYDRLGIGPLLTRYASSVRPALFLYLVLMRDLRPAERSLLAGRARKYVNDPDSSKVVAELENGRFGARPQQKRLIRPAAHTLCQTTVTSSEPQRRQTHKPLRNGSPSLRDSRWKAPRPAMNLMPHFRHER
jgi:hypothetical protein